MAEIIIPGPISGQSYGFRIKGDTPTVDEQMWIDNRVRQKESEFQAEYAARFGAPVETGEGEGVLNYLGEIPKGIARGGVNVLESALLGGAALLPEGAETRAREGIRSAAYTLKPQTDVGLEETVGGKFGEALGSFGAIGLTSLLPGGAFVAPALAVGAGAGEASERARAAGATAEERSRAALLGAPVGALELLPIKFIKVLGKPVTGTIVNRLSRAAAEGGVEGAQEAATTIAQNLIEQGVYNPDKGTFSDTGEALGYGAGVGALVQGLLDLLPGRSRTVVPPAPKPVDPADMQTQTEMQLTEPARPGFVSGQEQGELFLPAATPTATPTATPAATPTATPAATPAATPTATPAATPAATSTAAPKKGSVQPANAAPAADSDAFDVETTLDALRASDGQLGKATMALGIKYPELRNRVRALESEGLVAFDKASGKMTFPEAAKAAAKAAPKAAPKATPKATPEAAPQAAPKAAPKSADGWKLHLNPVPGSEQAIADYLAEKKIPHKVGRASGQAGKGMTVYVGSRDAADAVAADINSQFADSLNDAEGDVLTDDTPIAGKVWGRFDAPKSPEFHQYGAAGVPFLADDMSQLNYAEDRATAIEDAKKRADALLRRKYGAYYTGSADVTTAAPKAAPAPQGAAIRRTSGYEGPSADVIENRMARLNEIIADETKPERVRREAARRLREFEAYRENRDVMLDQNAVDDEQRAAVLSLVPDDIITATTEDGYTVTGTISGWIPEGTINIQDEDGFYHNVMPHTVENIQRGARPAAAAATPAAKQDELAKKQAELTKNEATIAKNEAKIAKNEADMANISDMLRAAEAQRRAAEEAQEIKDDTESAAAQSQETGDGVQGGAQGVGEGAGTDGRGGTTEDTAASGTGGLGASVQPSDNAGATDGAESGALAPDRTAAGVASAPAGTVFTGAPTEIQLRDAERQLESIRAVREVAANSAAQSELNAEWDARMANEPELASLIADYSTPDAVVKEDPTTSQDKQKILTLLRPGGFKKGKTGEAPAENAHAYFSLFKRPIDAIEFIVADVELKNQRFKDEAALEKEIGLLPGGDEAINPVERAFFSGMTQRRAKQALTWVKANMSPQAQVKVRELQSMYKQAEAVKVPNKVSSSLGSSTAIGGRSANLEERQRFEQDLAVQAQTRAAQKAEDKQLVSLGGKGLENLLAAVQETRAPTLRRAPPPIRNSAPVDLTETLIDTIFEARGAGKKPLSLNKPQDVLDLEARLHPAVINALQNGNLEMALRALELYAPNARVKRIASVLAPYAKGTSVRVVEDLRDTDGTKLAGQYRRSLPGKPSEILLDGNVGLSIETLLHEMTHAATIKEMLNPASPLRKRMEKLFNDVKPKLSTSNGSRNVLEFMADAFSNPRFQSELSRIYPNGGRFSALWRIANDAMNLVRRLLGLQPRQLSNALDMTDQLVMGMLNFPTSPSDISTPQEAATILNRVAAVDGSFPARTKEFAQEFGDDASRVLDGASYGAKRAVLGFMNSQALADVASHYKISGGYDLQKAIDQFDAAAIKSDSEVDVVLDVGQRWVKNNPRLKPLFDRLVHRSTVNQVDPSLPRNQAIKKYGADSDKMREYDAMQPDWAAIGNSGHDLYNNMRELYRKQYERLREALAGKIDFILQANPELAAEVKASIYTKFFDMNRIEPYFPLARKGDYWLEYSAFDPETNTTEPVRETYESPNARARAAKELESMPGVVKGPDGKPVTSFYSTLDLVQQGRTPDSLFVRDTLAIIQSNLSNTGVDEATAKSIQQEITKLFVDALPETSFAKSLQRRKNTRGYMEDSLEALRVKGYSLGRQGVRYSYSNKIRAVTDGIVQQAKQTNDQNKIAVIAELAARSDFAVNPPNTAFERGVQNANRLAFTYTLGFNVSSSLVNLSSVPVVLYPYLSGRYGSKSAAVAIGNAYKIFANSGLKREIELPAEFEGKKTATVTAMPSIDNYFVLQEKRTVGADGKAVVTQEYVPRNDVAPELRPMLEELSTLVDIASKNGQLNRSIFYDSIGAENVGRARNFWDRFSAIGGAAFHQVERANRQVALVASYNLELARLRNKPKDAERGLTPAEQRTRAAERAIYQATETGGGATLAAAPRFAQQGIGRIALMYKNFGLSLFYLQMKLIKQLTLGSNDPDFTPEDRKVAFKQLMGLQLSSFALAGISGVPLYGLVSTVADAFLGDDEEDADSLTRKYLGEGLYKGYLSEISGLDISSRIGLTGLLIRENRYNTDPSAEETLVANLGGPAWSTATQIGRGVSELYSAMTGGEGDVVRGIENMVPAAVRNFIKAGRYAAEGGDIETRRKDLITGDLGASDLLGQALGFTPTKATLAQDLNQLTVRISNNIVQKRSRLSKLYYIALREGDIEGAKEIMEDIRSFNEDVARRFPEAVIDGEFIKDSLKSHQRTSKEMSTGVSLNPAVREGLEDMKAQYNQGFQLF